MRMTASGSFTCALGNAQAERQHLLRIREPGIRRAAAPGTSGSSGPSRRAAPAPAPPARPPACCARGDARGSRSTSGRRRADPPATCGPAYLKTGIAPKSRPATIEIVEREQQHRRVDRDVVEPRQVAGRERDEQRAPRRTRAPSPATPPTRPSMTLSASSSYAIRPRLAPSAARTASSCCRPSARTSSRFATLAHAISSTMPIVPISTHSTEPTSPITSAFSSRRFGCELRLLEHLQAEALERREARRDRSGSAAATSAVACSSVAPGFRRATAV